MDILLYSVEVVFFYERLDGRDILSVYFLKIMLFIAWEYIKSLLIKSYYF